MGFFLANLYVYFFSLLAVVVVVDGLDSCEQSRVLSVLDAVHMLFSDEGSPFIILLAIDPHVITKAIELNIHQVFRGKSLLKWWGTTFLPE